MPTPKVEFCGSPSTSVSTTFTTRKLRLFVSRENSENIAIMEHDPEKPHSTAKEVEHDAIYAEKAAMADYRAGAIEAENEEHNMTVMQAVRAYPMASFWAFVMSSCIVSCCFFFFFYFVICCGDFYSTTTS